MTLARREQPGFDRERADLPADLRWPEWMRRIEAVLFAFATPVARDDLVPAPVDSGVPKTGFKIESLVTATTRNIGNLERGKEPDQPGTWNDILLANFGKGGDAFVSQPMRGYAICATIQTEAVAIQAFYAELGRKPAEIPCSPPHRKMASSAWTEALNPTGRRQEVESFRGAGNDRAFAGRAGIRPVWS